MIGGLIHAVDFSSGPRPCYLGLSSPVFKLQILPNSKTSYIITNALGSLPRTLTFQHLCNSLEYVKPGVEPSPTLRLTTQAITRLAHGGLDLGPHQVSPTLEGLPRGACHIMPWWYGLLPLYKLVYKSVNMVKRWPQFPRGWCFCADSSHKVATNNWIQNCGKSLIFMNSE
jgi:hypothetical protein